MEQLSEYLLLQSRLRPHATAVSDEYAALTFSQLYAAALNMSDMIRSRTVAAGLPVIVMAQRSVLAYVMLMGVLCSGCCYAPVDVKAPPERLRYIVKKLNARAAVTTSSFAERLTEAGFSGELVICDEADISEPTAQPVDVSTDQPAYILFTSGSTGEPKGVTVSHRAVIHHMCWQTEHIPIGEGAVLGGQAPFYFDASMPDIFTPLFTGAQLHIIPERHFLLPSKLISYINCHGINTLIWVPSALMLLSAREGFGAERISDLRTVMFCGEVMPTSQLERWRSVYPDAVFVHMYGPTEAAYGCTYYIVDRSFREDEQLPLGAPCEGTDIRLAGGELCILGERLALGYFGDPELTAERFVTASDGQRMYRTGDLAEYNERGELVFRGRADRQIKHHGYRIELGEIESAALCCSGVINCRVIYADGELCLFCAAKELTEKELYKSLKRRLPVYMLPTRIVLMDALPLNRNGKTDETALQSML